MGVVRTVEGGRSGSCVRLVPVEQRSVFRKCDRVIVNARGTETLETEYVGLSREQFRLIRNGYDDLDFDGVANLHEPLDAHRFVLVHVGQLAKQGAAGVQRWHRFKKRIGLDYYPLRVEAMTRSPHFVLAAVERLLEQKHCCATTFGSGSSA